jgi:3-methylfumaryl-CoA hydratase
MHTSAARVSHDKLDILALLFDDDTFANSEGDILPALWHWAALSEWGKHSALRFDGHLKTVAPPIAGFGISRRLFGGGEIELHRPLVLGQSLQLNHDVVEVATKHGNSGEFVLVTEEITAYDDIGMAIVFTERQNVVYRKLDDQQAPHAIQTATPSLPVYEKPIVQVDDLRWRVQIDPVMLMRFSAATSNSHRIHYDRTYASTVEGHSGLVVHGPFMTLAMADVLRKAYPGLVFRSMKYRHSSPLYCGAEAYIRMVETDSAHSFTLQLYSQQSNAERAIVHSTLEASAQ